MQFKTKARAVDLLGKGQIADLPTAIIELWKNGYDAYADLLETNLYKNGYEGITNSYITIFDDGKGMSHSDILEKWLILGTDSKSRTLNDIESEETLWKKPRIKSGEKGIGRLSVAYLGSPMLMITKKIGHPIQIIYFDWRILENFNLLLEDIFVPIIQISDLNILNDNFNDLKTQFLTNIVNEVNKDNQIIWENSQIELKDHIWNDTIFAELEPPIIENIIKYFNSDDSHGTMFIIFKPISQIIELAEKDEDDTSDKKFFTSSLVNFTNPFKKERVNIDIKFNIYKDNLSYDLLQSSGEFFNNSDFEIADVYIKGVFDGTGNFEGILKFHNETIPYSFSNPRKRDKRNNYGEVPFELGYSMGDETRSELSEFEYQKINTKVTEYGGIYIFRDDFRVLPYGRGNYDFLGIEGRRNLRAGTYFFSYRRMYGYLSISRSVNPNLIDKSSREGLLNNIYFRLFTQDVSQFLVSVALDYFATKPKISSIFRDKIDEIKEQNQALKADKEREKYEKISFTKSLNDYPVRIDKHRKEYNQTLDCLDLLLNEENISYSNIEELLNKLHRLDIERNNIIPRIPKRYKPTDTQLDRLYKIEEEYILYNNNISLKRENINKKAIEKLEIRDIKIDFTKKYNIYINSFSKKTDELRTTLNNRFNLLSTEYDDRVKRLQEVLTKDKSNTIESITSKDEIQYHIESLELKYNNILVEVNKTLQPLIDHINRITFDIDEEVVQGAYKEQFEKMKYQWEQTRDTAQLGIAVEIIDHEFNQLYSTIKSQIEIIGSNYNVDSIKEFKLLDKNFKQLEDKYTLLSPLYRISGAKPKEIKCNSIYNYLNSFFEIQISKNNIKVLASESFREHTIIIKEPIIHTVFINIINNAIYWMRNKSERVIQIDYKTDTNEIIIANSGENISEHKLDKIFDLFYSQRPNGRGIGLYLSKQCLNEVGLDIYATNNINYNTLNGACFVITQINN